MYRLIRFGTIELEYANQVDKVGLGPTPVSYFSLPEGGALDGFGSMQKFQGTTERTKSVRLVADNEQDLSDIYFRLLSMVGKRDKLYRRLVSGLEHYVYARLVEVTASRTYELTRYRMIQDVDLRFVCQETFWKGAYHGVWNLDSGIRLDAGYTLDSPSSFTLEDSPEEMNISVGSTDDPGRAPVRSVKIVVLAGDAEMSNVVIEREDGERLEYTGTIPAAGALEINCGTMQVSCSGTENAYDNLAFGEEADMTTWFSLLPGDNAITVGFTGGGSGASIEFTFYEAWY